MRVMVVFESMFGNTRIIAESVAEGLGPEADVTVVPVTEAGQQWPDQFDLVVVGGPTHVRGMSRPRTRRGAPSYVTKSTGLLALEQGYDGPGVRGWLNALAVVHTHGAAFDTRMKGPALGTGRASRGIARQLRRHGFDLVVGPESFLVDRKHRLLAGERERARTWGAVLAKQLGRLDVTATHQSL